MIIPADELQVGHRVLQEDDRTGKYFTWLVEEIPFRSEHAIVAYGVVEGTGEAMTEAYVIARGEEVEIVE